MRDVHRICQHQRVPNQPLEPTAGGSLYRHHDLKQSCARRGSAASRYADGAERSSGSLTVLEL